MEIDSVEQSQDLGTQGSSPESSTENQSGAPNTQQEAQAIAELEKLGRFKFEGREMTASELKKAIMRQQDYTQKTQSLAEERKFAENLYWDLKAVEKNPSLASEFLKTYPQKYHPYLKEILEGAKPQQEQHPQNQQANQIPFEMLSDINEVKTFMQEQKVAKAMADVDKNMSELSKKYPDAIPDLALAKVFNWHVQNKIEVTPQLWEKAFKEVDSQLKGHFEGRYKKMVSEQSTANKKAQDVDAGGGTPGRAPPKFNSIKDVGNFAVNELTRKG